MKFSIITPVHAWHKDKIKQLERCVSSVQNQSFKDYEHIIIDDGSKKNIEFVSKYDKVIYKKCAHMERVTSYNTGMRMAKGDWFCFLDSDDEYFSYALEAMNQMTEKNPDYKLFNFSSYHVNKNYGTITKGPYMPKKLKDGHESFGRGNIVNGTFFFHRSIYDKLGGYPGDENGLIKDIDCSEVNYGKVRDLHMGSPWDFSAAFQLEFPEMRGHFMIDRKTQPHKIICELGNPWGQDYALFYKYTRKYHCKSYGIQLYIVHHNCKKEGEIHELKD